MEQRVEEFEYEEMADKGPYLPVAGAFIQIESPRLPLSLDTMTQEEINAELQKAWDNIQAGNVFTEEEVFAELARDFGV